VEAGLVASAAVAFVTGLWLWSAPKSRAKEQDQAQRDAAIIVVAAAAWIDRGERGCPTVSKLVEERDLAPNARRDDPWGQRFRIECDQERLSVWSPGADGRRSTGDDVRVVAGAD